MILHHRNKALWNSGGAHNFLSVTVFGRSEWSDSGKRMRQIRARAIQIAKCQLQSLYAPEPARPPWSIFTLHIFSPLGVCRKKPSFSATRIVSSRRRQSAVNISNRHQNTIAGKNLSVPIICRNVTN